MSGGRRRIVTFLKIIARDDAVFGRGSHEGVQEIAGDGFAGMQDDVDTVATITHRAVEPACFRQRCHGGPEAHALHASADMDMVGGHGQASSATSTLDFSQSYHSPSPSPLVQLSSMMGMPGLTWWIYSLQASTLKGT